MPLHSLTFYETDPFTAGFPTGTGTATYTGPADQLGTIDVTDNGAGNAGLHLEDTDNGEDATADVTLNSGDQSLGVLADTGETWLVRDTVTLQIFIVAHLEVDTGDAAGSYTISEKPLVPGRSYDLLQYEASGDADTIAFRYAEFVCYATGTLLRTPNGEAAVENLSVGDLLVTRDRGAKPIRWIGRRKLTFADGASNQRPVLLPAGCLGRNTPARDLVVSPQHCILMRGRAVRRDYRVSEVLVPAGCLTGFNGIREMRGKRDVVYHSLLMDRHEILIANGAYSESLYPGPVALGALGPSMRREIERLFPRLRSAPGAGYGPRARRVLKGKHATALVETLKGAAIALA